ncbi:FecR domain-containing protein [Candidatus Peregrinibacteria bacterium]|nr:FecR domain-containing protein [Candidatus Peregrinibacteria bacterium]
MDHSTVLARQHRFRHGYLGIARRERTMGLWIRGGIIITIIISGMGLRKALVWLHADWRVDHPGATVHVEKGNAATVSVNGEEPLPVEGSMNMYEGDTLNTKTHSTATIAFFDGTRMRLDEETTVTIQNMRQGTMKNAMNLELVNGKIWIALPKDTASGETLLHVKTPVFALEFPPGTEALIERSALAVFDSGNALGVVLRTPGTPSALYIGEGQQITLPEELQGHEQNLYVFRSPLDPTLSASPFVEKSRETSLPPPPKQSIAPPPPEELLSILAPDEGSIALSDSIKVRGTFGRGVTSIRVNGYLATTEEHTFSQELALPSDEKIDIRIAALNENGIIIAEQSRTVRRDLQPPPSPQILLPAGSGTIFRTTKTEIELRGTVQKGVAGIIVNEYRLQLFQPGDTVWSYLASTNLDNFHPGTNIYEVVAIDDAGNRSAPVRIQIIPPQKPTERTGLPPGDYTYKRGTVYDVPRRILHLWNSILEYPYSMGQ